MKNRYPCLKMDSEPAFPEFLWPLAAYILSSHWNKYIVEYHTKWDSTPAMVRRTYLRSQCQLLPILLCASMKSTVYFLFHIYLFMATEHRMNKLPVQDTGTLGSWGQKPKHKNYLDFIIKWKPETKKFNTSLWII